MMIDHNQDHAVVHNAWEEAGGCVLCAGTGWRARGRGLVPCECDSDVRTRLGIDPLPEPRLAGVASAWRLIHELPSFPWLRPQREVSEAELAELVAEHDRALSAYGPVSVRTTVRIVHTVAAWDAARDTAWDAAWDAARGVARAAAWDAVWAAASASARASARGYTTAVAWGAAWDAGKDAAWDAARAATHLVSGIDRPNPWSPLVEIWRLGCAPVVHGAEAVIYVPPVGGER
jgi:hypothetical protein